jgi:redox-sensitive bicupin YhaK (pirin superfamily)
MKKIFYPALERGQVDFGWLKARHSFSFGHYYHPEKIHFGALRVLNDDHIAGGTGFNTHPHDNMEIVTIPLEGALAHKDSTGGEGIIRQHDVQIMSAGTGIYHSEKNAHHNMPVKLLQIWVMPQKYNITPRYDQKTDLPESYHNQLKTVVAPDDENALWINQDAYFVLGNLDESFETQYKIKKEKNGVYAFLIEGKVEVNGQNLNPRDAVGIWETDFISIKTFEKSRILLIEVPMQLQ